ncbi:hypothetical protein Q7P37_009906 [Cladosporium fusiforme]
MFASTLGAVLFSLRGQNRERTCDHTQISPGALEKDQDAPPLTPYDAGGRGLDAGPDPFGVDFGSAHDDRFHHRSIVARLASSVEGLEARLDLQERQLQRLAGQVAKETCGSPAETQSDRGTATAEKHETCYEANTSREPPVEAQQTGGGGGVSHTTSTSMGTRSVKASSKKAGRSRRLHDLKINGTPKLDLHHGSNNHRNGLMKSHRYNRCYRLKRGNDTA